MDLRRARVVPALRKAALAEDYMLQASAVVALARLGDRDSIGLIEGFLASSRIPRVRISSAFALEILQSRESVPTLVSCLRTERDPAFVSDELVLSTAAILGMMPAFYAMYAAFLEVPGRDRSRLAAPRRRDGSRRSWSGGAARRTRRSRDGRRCPARATARRCPSSRRSEG